MIYGAIHGTVVDESGQAVTTAKLTLKSDNDVLMGGCTDSLDSGSAEGAFAFNAVPFDTPLALTVSAPGYVTQTMALTLPKGPMQVLALRLKRS